MLVKTFALFVTFTGSLVKQSFIGDHLLFFTFVLFQDFSLKSTDLHFWSILTHYFSLFYSPTPSQCKNTTLSTICTPMSPHHHCYPAPSFHLTTQSTIKKFNKRADTFPLKCELHSPSRNLWH